MCVLVVLSVLRFTVILSLGVHEEYCRLCEQHSFPRVGEKCHIVNCQFPSFLGAHESLLPPNKGYLHPQSLQCPLLTSLPCMHACKLQLLAPIEPAKMQIYQLMLVKNVVNIFAHFKQTLLHFLNACSHQLNSHLHTQVVATSLATTIVSQSVFDL